MNSGDKLPGVVWVLGIALRAVPDKVKRLVVFDGFGEERININRRGENEASRLGNPLQEVVPKLGAQEPIKVEGLSPRGLPCTSQLKIQHKDPVVGLHVIHKLVLRLVLKSPDHIVGVDHKDGTGIGKASNNLDSGDITTELLGHGFGGDHLDMVALGLRRLFAALRVLGPRHGNCKASNFLFDGARLWVLHLDAMRRLPGATFVRRGLARDRARLLRSLDAGGAQRVAALLAAQPED